MFKTNQIVMLCVLLLANIALAEEEPASSETTMAEANQQQPDESQAIIAAMEAALAPYRDALINANNYYKAVKLDRSVHGENSRYSQQDEDTARQSAQNSYDALQSALKAESNKAMLAAETAAKNKQPKIDVDSAKAELAATQKAQSIAAMKRLCNKVGYAIDQVNVNNGAEVADATNTCKIKLAEMQEQAKLAKENAMDARKKQVEQEQTALNNQKIAAAAKQNEIRTIAINKANERAEFLRKNPSRRNPAFYN